MLFIILLILVQILPIAKLYAVDNLHPRSRGLHDSGPAQADLPTPITKVIGLGYDLNLPVTSGPIRVIHGDTIKITDQKKSLLVMGKKLGFAIIHSPLQTYRIQIIRERYYRAYLAIEKLVRDQSSLHLSYDDHNILISGTINEFALWKQISQKVSPDVPFVFKAKLSPMAKADACLYFDQRQRQRQLPSYTVQWANVPEVLISSKSEKRQGFYKEIFAPFGIRVRQDSNALSTQPMIKIRLYFTEVKEATLQHIGVQWPQGFNAEILPNQVWLEHLSVQLQAMEQSGQGRVLASPSIVTASGQVAEFFSGGELPIKILGPRRQSVQWKKYGLTFKVTPLLTPSGQLHLNLSTEISNLDNSQNADGIPGISSHRMSTQLQLQDVHPIIISGLTQVQSGQQKDGLAGLARIPLLGALFSSQNYRSNKSQIVVFLEPEILSESEVSPGG